MGFNLGSVGKSLKGFVDPSPMGMGGYKRAVNQSMAGVREGYGQARDAYQPFMQGTTAAGLGTGIADLINSSTYQNLVGERGQAMQDYLGGVGLSRSGYGVNEMADLSQDTLLGLEGMLSGRQFAGAQAMTPLYTGEASDIAGLLTGLEAAKLGAKQQAQQTGAANIGSILNLGGTLGGAAMMRPV